MEKTLLRTAIFTAAGYVLFLAGGCKKEETPTEEQVTSHTYSVATWNYTSPEYYADLGVPELTAGNVNTAGVLVYYSASSGVWTSVPYTVYGTVHDYHMGFKYNTGTVEVTWMYDGSTAGSDPNTYYSTTVLCKVVIVPSSARMANPGLDWNNYEAVKKRFNLAG